MVTSSLVDLERERRASIWGELLAGGGTKRVLAARVNELRIFYGGRGIWTQKERTGALAPDGVTVGVLHTGLSYADDLHDDGIVYHYPTTKSSGRDAAEVAATKAAQELALPIFVVTRPTPHSKYRNIDLGWVEGFDDASRMFLIAFAAAPPPPLLDVEVEDDAPFNPTDKVLKKRAAAFVRTGQARFKFQVFRRYGTQCAVCRIGLPQLLDAAHIRSRREEGTNDPRNGLVLCALHHRAFDAGLFAIRPSDYAIVCNAEGPDAAHLRITKRSLQHLTRKPHVEALDWRWTAWLRLAEAFHAPAVLS
jgi:putative restriction endonuclease